MPKDIVTLNLPAVSRLIDHLVESQALPCASVLVHKSGQEIFYHEAGFSDVERTRPVSRKTIFRLFSMTKPITAAAVMILVDEGILQLEDMVSDFIPEFSNLAVYLGQDGDVLRTAPAQPIRIHHLLTHTAGFTYWFYPDTPVGALYAADPGIGGVDEKWRFDAALGGLDGLARSLARMPLIAQPGERWHYSMSIDVAGILVERASGASLDHFMKNRIFDPLGMDDTGFSVPQHKSHRLASLYGPGADDDTPSRLTSLNEPQATSGLALIEDSAASPLIGDVPGFSGGGGLVSTIEDYSRFAQLLLNEGKQKDRRILSQQSAQTMMSNQLKPEQLSELPQLAALGLGGTGEGLGFGLGGSVAINSPSNDVPVFPGEYSWGGGASTTFWVDPANQLSVVFMTQHQPPSNQMIRDKLHKAIYAGLA